MLAFSLALFWRFDAVVNRIAQQMQQGVGQASQHVRVHHDAIANNVQHDLLACGAGSLRYVAFEARHHGFGGNQARRQQFPVLVNKGIAFVAQYRAGISSVCLSLLHKLLAVLHCFRDSA